MNVIDALKQIKEILDKIEPNSTGEDFSEFAPYLPGTRWYTTETCDGAMLSIIKIDKQRQLVYFDVDDPRHYLKYSLQEAKEYLRKPKEDDLASNRDGIQFRAVKMCKIVDKLGDDQEVYYWPIDDGDCTLNHDASGHPITNQHWYSADRLVFIKEKVYQDLYKYVKYDPKKHSGDITIYYKDPNGNYNKCDVYADKPDFNYRLPILIHGVNNYGLVHIDSLWVKK